MPSDALYVFSQSSKRTWLLGLPLLNPIESVYLLGLVPLELYCNLLHWCLGLQDRLPFLPLLITSVYCALGIVYAWIKLYYITLTDIPSKRLKTQ